MLNSKITMRGSWGDDDFIVGVVVVVCWGCSWEFGFDESVADGTCFSE